MYTESITFSCPFVVDSATAQSATKRSKGSPFRNLLPIEIPTWSPQCALSPKGKSATAAHKRRICTLSLKLYRQEVCRQTYTVGLLELECIQGFSTGLNASAPICDGFGSPLPFNCIDRPSVCVVLELWTHSRSSNWCSDCVYFVPRG